MNHRVTAYLLEIQDALAGSQSTDKPCTASLAA